MDGTNDVPQPTIKVYKRRWAMLSLYFIVGSVTVMQWTQYVIIADVVVKYYNVSYEIVNWSMMIFLLVFIVFVLPGNYVLHALGLRNFFLLTSFLQCVGCWLKILAVNPNRFWLALVCQAIFGLTHVFILSIPSLIAMTWFDINEISTATSIGTLQPQLSSALGFIIPTFIISSTYEENVFERNLFIMVLTIAIFSTVCLVLIFFFFEDKPPIPPSEAQFYHERGRKHLLNIVPFVKHLMQNSSFMLILFICGINNGIMGSIDTLLNQIIVQNYEDSSTEAGRIVCLEYLLGSAGNLVAGIILDKFHHFKITMRTSQGICFLLMIIFTYIIQRGILGLYIVLSFIG
ncbi:hypothetical protein FQA39_LY12387 [Lamprigera yunnana]|nr:hypothetical protein FQA39_LY12387 [Lamprigera yunnana]